MTETSTPLNVAVIGYGFSAKIFHIPFIAQLSRENSSSLRLYGIVQRNPTPSDDATKEHADIKTWRSSDEMLEDVAVDVVVVTTLPESHFALTKAALEKGKHVIVEKPFVPTSAEAEELDRISKEKGKLIAVYQNRRYDTDFLAVSSLIRDGTLGRVTEFESHFDRYAPVPSNRASWRAEARPGTGQIYDLGTHLMDQIVALYGLPDRITAFIGNQRSGVPLDAEPGDSFTALLHYDNVGLSVDGEKGPLLATAKASVVSPEKDQLRYWVRGTKGSFKKFHFDCQEEMLLAGKMPWDEGFGIEGVEASGAVTTVGESEEMKTERLVPVSPSTYTEFYRRFVKAVRGDGEVPVSAKDGANVIRLVELCKESSKTGRTLQVKPALYVRG
ncbi:putative NAD binding Rossmann fold oxidoreductase [Saccharata proteae CBS 121410]|uniref:NAD binding Rossmann fold oxidoreductase n=1 Tax=Saccharata proteae CBS 121410 TaxID=1314787 RepID=A0A9P4HTV4_9PEZI|nr:putative NAD binding Rossmann fold oxidoreductase [Saccharata proteae CBS 121410]